MQIVFTLPHFQLKANPTMESDTVDVMNNGGKGCGRLRSSGSCVESSPLVEIPTTTEEDTPAVTLHDACCFCSGETSTRFFEDFHPEKSAASFSHRQPKP